MELFPVKTPIIQPGDNIVEIALKSLENVNLSLLNGDILIFAETPVGTTQNRIVDHSDIKTIGPIAKKLSKKYEMDPVFVQIIVNEADIILGGVKGVLLTEKDGVLIANAGVDQSNSGGLSKYSLFPNNPMKTASEIRNDLLSKIKIEELGVIIADSRVQPMKKGTIGVAIGVSGFEPIEDCVGRKDLFGRPLEITTRALADDLVSAAQALMGEADEQIPIVLIRNAPVIFTNREIQAEEMLMSRDRCLFMNVFKDLAAYKKPEYKKNKK
ncbi:MAG: coenzyme F420-0:L-glutamate ligase [archaeon]|nr:coenzyme F420-0:L-glutamate ligase [archaeon]